MREATEITEITEKNITTEITEITEIEKVFRCLRAGAIREMSPAVGVSFSVFERDIRGTLVREQLVATLSAFFAVVAAALAIIGLYGVVAYSVTRRTKEIGVRMALGARRADVLRLILSEAVTLIAIGVALGIPAVLASGRATEALLFGVPPSDPLTLAAAAGSLVTVALAASYVPARSATQIEPMSALRID